MKPEKQSHILLSVTRSKAKMFEYGINEEYHINIQRDPVSIFTISIGMLGDFAAGINRGSFDSDLYVDLKRNLRFSAYFFDAYLNSRLNNNLDPYLILLGSASYYLCDLPGSASVLIRRMPENYQDIDALGLEKVLFELVRSDLRNFIVFEDNQYKRIFIDIQESLQMFLNLGEGKQKIETLADNLRKIVYESGSPRQLLFGDVISAILRKKIENSIWTTIPSYSGISKEIWSPAFRKDSFVKELWPAQRILGEADVFRGKSAIVQMPTSAGKTKAIELILRSAFLSNRATLAAIVAPFKALCNEINNSLVTSFNGEEVKVNELTDALQTDFDVSELLTSTRVIVLTPEKLLYILRHNPELPPNIGLIIFDEGHQFDAGIRGVTYELLLTSLRSLLPLDSQKILISAVIKNAEEIGTWLNGEANVVNGSNLTPTIRSSGFVSWLDQLGRIEYVNEVNPDQGEFFVPRVIEKFNLGKRGKERANRFFPSRKDDGQSISLYLGLRLMSEGSIAIFCGRKTTAVSICEKALDSIDRKVPLRLPMELSNQEEVQRLHNLHIKNLGTSASASKCAGFGIFSHHGNIPHGIRIAVENAMREGHIRFVICTSTLAQGVNLPIRYLIVTSVYQGLERIKVRDFHNLIGRAGRAGMHTEGSILFADPGVYDQKSSKKQKWRWEQVKELLEPKNSEPCISNLLSIFDPISNDRENDFLEIDPLELVNKYINDKNILGEMAIEMAIKYKSRNFSQPGIERQISWKINLISAIESFLLSHWDEGEVGLSEEDIKKLAEETLAFYLATVEQKEKIRNLFITIARNIEAVVPEPSRRIVFGKTLFGVHDALSIESWVREHIISLSSDLDNVGLLELLWPLMINHMPSKILKKFNKPELLTQVAMLWIGGHSYSYIFEFMNTNNVKMIWGKSHRKFTIYDVVDICEGGLAYDGALLIGAVYEFLSSAGLQELDDLIRQLQLLQKSLSYGLPTDTTIAVYELGFSDRVIAQDLAEQLSLSATQRPDLINAFRQNEERARFLLNSYPLYYQLKMSQFI